MNDEQKIIEQAKKSFNYALANTLYNEILKDDTHLQSIIQGLKIKPNGRILDLGTGTGYIAFPVARMFSDYKVVGLDLADNIIENNNKRVAEDKLTNLNFLSYDGISFPFGSNSFSNIVTRYALHHFPSIDKTFSDLSKIIEPDGQFFISDPMPNEDDENRIIDEYMNVKNDGHIKFYTTNEFESLLRNHGFVLDTYFITEMHVAFPERESYLKVTSTVDERMINSYNIKIIDNKVHLDLKIQNLSFIKTI